MRFPSLALVLALATSASAQNDHALNDNNSPTVDVELALAVDVSYSMDTDELAAQREGYAQAIVSREFLDALKTGPHGKIALTFFKWSSSNDQKIIVPWRVIDGQEAAAKVAAEIMKAPVRRYSRTSISGAINFAITLFDQNPHRGLRRVIDVSGNGPNNSGEPVVGARDRALAKGIIIDGLAMVWKKPSPSKDDIENLDAYYEDCVIGGPGAFVTAVEDREKFKDAIRTKLAFEVAGMAPERPNGSLTKKARVSCLIGEEIWERGWNAPPATLNSLHLAPRVGLSRFTPSQNAEILATIRTHLGRCWTASRTGPTIELQLYYKPDGTYSSPPVLVNPENTAEYSRTAARVLQQINKCPPLKFSKKEYQRERNLIWRFESRESAGASRSNKT